MKHMPRYALCFALQLFTTTMILSQAPTSPITSKSTVSISATKTPKSASITFNHQPPMSPPGAIYEQMPLVFPLYLEDQEYTSVLTLVNPIDTATYVDIDLRDESGDTFASEKVQMPRHSQKEIKLDTLVRKTGRNFPSGSIFVRNNTALKASAVQGVLKYYAARA